MHLDYRIDATQPGLRHLAVVLEFDVRPGTAGAGSAGVRVQQLFQATWTPGSYLVREYSRHLGRVEAFDAATGVRIACRKVRKNRFELQLPDQTVRVRVTWSVYAHDLSVRTADLTPDHAYWNHACVLLWPLGEPEREARIHVAAAATWRVACSLPRGQRSGAPAAPGTTITTLVARDLDHALDSPVLAGAFERLDWEVGGVPHSIVLDGLGVVPPPVTLCADLTAIVETARTVFGGNLPYESYLFLCLFTTDGHGGLEHADSTTLLVSRTAFGNDKGYREFLGLAAHELFHVWNVKRMRPVEYWQYDYESENYTEMLWLIEGWTAYFDDLICLRAGLMKREDYLAILARNVSTMRTGPGRRRLSLRESSFDAWIRLYRPDENSRNSSQNYYVNGAVAALCLDLTLRQASKNSCSLDTVLRDLYRETFARGRGYTLDDVHDILRRQGGDRAVATLEALVAGELDPDVESLLAEVGIRTTNSDAQKPHLGVNFEPGGTVVASVAADSAAFAAGIAPADELLALRGLRVDANRWPDVWKAVAKVGEPIEILLARRGVIARCEVTPRPGPGTLGFELDPDAAAEKRRACDDWLGARTAPRTPPTGATS